MATVGAKSHRFSLAMAMAFRAAVAAAAIAAI